MICRTLFACFLSLFTFVFAYADGIAYKVDANGSKVFYNIPSPHPTTTTFQNSRSAIFFSSKSEDYFNLVQQVAAKHGVDARLVKAVIQVESNFNERARSPKGACGLMQLMPATASRYGVDVDQIFDPQQNIDGGVRYLRDLLSMFNSDLSLAVAAYNAGEGAVQRFNGIPNYNETQNYVRKVLALYDGKNAYSAQIPMAKPIVKPSVFYKFVDDKGVVHFQTTPVSGVETTKLTYE
jgi:Soluble lytic murein transglycosylase and related regulatory proteins (some contain LysM/invasin domains)